MKKISLILFGLLFYSGVFSQAVNIDFEASSPGTYSTSNAVSGWTLSSQTASCNSSASWTPGSAEFSVVATPVISFPTIGNIPNSPLGGTNVVSLNNSTANSSKTKLSQTFSVNPSLTLIQCAFAGVWEGYTSHQCCEQSGFLILLKDQSGNLLACTNYSYAPGTGCSFGSTTYSTTSTTAWSNWQVKYFDLTPYVGSLVTIEIISTDCSYGDHFGTTFFDVKFVGQIICYCLSYSNPQITSVNFCPGSNIAQLNAPFGYPAYQWFAPGTGSVAAPQGTMSTLTVTNPISNSVYTVMMLSAAGCVFTSTLMIVSSSVSIAGIGSSSSCIGGASGSATVYGNGSGTGYTYAWYNSTNSLVSTNSVANNLPAGIYSITLMAAGSQSAGCGTASATLAIGTNTGGLISKLKPFCNTEAYLSYPGGTNYQWYNNLSPITASLGGTASSYTVTNPTNGGIYHLTYITSQGCQDSLKITLVSVSPGTLILVSNPVICQGATNGSVALTMYAAPGAVGGNNWFTLSSTGTTSPYSSSVNPTSSTTFSANNLSAGGTYTVNAFDGSCKYGLGFTVMPYLFDYTLSLTPSPTVCSGSSIIGGINTTNQAAYTYSWSPNTFLASNSSSFPFITITPTAASGSLNTLIYTIVVTPTSISCPLTKTLAVTAASLLTPTISSIPILCDYSANYSIQVNPSGGTFFSGTNSPIGATSGILTPSLANLGSNNFNYVLSAGACVINASSSYTIQSVPLNVSSSATIFCGQSLTLSATGADTYSWNNSVSTSSMVVTPLNTSTYIVVGTNTITSCSKTASLQITVNPSLNISIMGNNFICAGVTTSLTASGANSYTWSNGNVGNPLIISPQATTIYTVTGTAINGCTNTAIKTQSVAPNPTLIISGNYTICPGRESFLAAYGASTYTWSNGSQSQFLTLSPSETTTYSVIGIDYQGCSSTKTVTIVVEGCVGVNEFYSSDLEIKIYPNPSSGNVFLETEHTVQINIFDDLGKLISQKELEKGMHRIDLREYNSGVYLLKISEAHSLKVLKLLKTD
jgi:hypothetical protein